MQRTSVIQEEWWDLKAEVSWGNAPVGQDVVALRAENDQLRRALVGRVVIDQACGMVMALPLVPPWGGQEPAGGCLTAVRSQTPGSGGGSGRHLGG